MGASVTKQLINVTQEVLNQTVTNILQRNETNITTFVSADQNVKILIGPQADVECTDSGNLVTQSITGNVVITDSVTTNTAGALQNLFQSSFAIDGEVAQKMKSELGGSFLTFTDTEQEVNLSSAVKNIITNNVTQENINDIIRQFTFNQGATITILGKFKGPCAVSQNIVLSIQASAIVDNITKSIITNEVVNDLVTKIAASQAVEIQGLSTIVDSFGKAIAGIISAVSLSFAIPFVIVGIVIFIMIGGVSKIGKSDSKGSKWGRGVLIGFIVALVVVCIVLLVLFIMKRPPFSQTPKLSDECLVLFNKMKEINKKIEAATSDEEKNKILTDEKDTIKKYNECEAK
jgi:hypothetical protein